MGPTRVRPPSATPPCPEMATYPEQRTRIQEKSAALNHRQTGAPSSSLHEMKSRLPQIVLAFAWVLIIVAASFLPYHLKQDLHTKGRLPLWYHTLACGLGALLLANAAWSRTVQIAALFTALLIGCLLEFGQHSIYGTQLEIDDILMDCLGLMLGAMLFSVLRSRAPAPK